MKIVKFNKEEHLSSVMEFYNNNAYQNDYVPFNSAEMFLKTIVENESFSSDGFLIAINEANVCGIALAVIDVNVNAYSRDDVIPGYINFIIVEEHTIGEGIRTCLFNEVLSYFEKNNITDVHVSHKSPIKLSWIVPHKKAEHNKAPGVIVDSKSFEFFNENNFGVLSYELSYFLDLNEFYLTEEMKKLKNNSKDLGYEVVYFDEKKHWGQEEMFTRLKDESYREKFRIAQNNNEKIQVLVKDDEVVCGITGHIYVEENGRGFFQGISVDPLHSGKKLGNLLFYCLCEELKNLGSEYMTLFVSEDNFAKNIYEKVGFINVQRWAIMAHKGERNE